MPRFILIDDIPNGGKMFTASEHFSNVELLGLTRASFPEYAHYDIDSTALDSLTTFMVNDLFLLESISSLDLSPETITIYLYPDGLWSEIEQLVFETLLRRLWWPKDDAELITPEDFYNYMTHMGRVPVAPKRRTRRRRRNR